MYNRERKLSIVKGIQKRQAIVITKLANEHVTTGRFKGPLARGAGSTDGVYFVESHGVELQIRPITFSEDPRELWRQVVHRGRETPRLANCSESDKIGDVEEFFKDETEKFW
jgi:hypothetical protein